MKITDAVLILLGEHPMTASQIASRINATDERFQPLRAKWGAISADQVYAAMSGLRSKGSVSRTFIEPVDGRIGKRSVYTLTGYGEKRLRDMGTVRQSPATDAPVEAVNHPAHYGGADNPYEAIKVIEAWDLGFCLGNTVKYIARADHKGRSIEDLKKARWYLDREIEGREAGRRIPAD